MRSRRAEDDQVLVVGIFQSPEIGRAVLKNLRRARFRRAAVVHRGTSGRPRIEKHRISAIVGAAAASAITVALGGVIYLQRGILADYRPGGVAVLFVAFALAIGLSGWTV